MLNPEWGEDLITDRTEVEGKAAWDLGSTSTQNTKLYVRYTARQWIAMQYQIKTEHL